MEEQAGTKARELVRKNTLVRKNELAGARAGPARHPRTEARELVRKKKLVWKHELVRE
jgi:hypothetical protein